MNTARLWLGRQWGSEQLAQRLDRRAGSAHDAGHGDSVDRTTPSHARNARTVRGDDMSATSRESASAPWK